MEMEASPSVRHNTVNWINDCKPPRSSALPRDDYFRSSSSFCRSGVLFWFSKARGLVPACGSSPWVSSGQLGRSPPQRRLDAPSPRSVKQEPVSQTAKQGGLPGSRRRRRGPAPRRGGVRQVRARSRR